MDDPDGHNNALGALAARHARRTGDVSGILARFRDGCALTPDELALLGSYERGVKAKTGRKDPDAACETIVCCRWLIEVDGMTAANARSLLAEMLGATPDAVKGRIRRAKGLGANFATLCYEAHMQQGVTPALLRSRDGSGKCLGCRRVQCRCNPTPRPAFEDTHEGKLPAVLLSFWQLGG